MYFSTNWWGIWMAFLPRGEGIWTSQSSKVQMPGGLPGGGFWSFNLTGIWPYLYITFEVPKKIMSSRTLQVRRTSLKRSKYQTRQEYLDISKLKLTLYSLNLSLPWQSQQEPCAIKYGGQSWLDEAWLMAEKHSHRSLIRCKEIVCIYAETVKQEEGIVHKPSLQSDKSLSLKCWMLPKVVENRRQNAKSTSGRELLCAWSIRTQGHSAKPASQRGTDENPRENENANRFSNNIIWWYITKIAISVL